MLYCLPDDGQAIPRYGDGFDYPVNGCPGCEGGRYGVSLEMIPPI
jgi:hypothetical protein